MREDLQHALRLVRRRPGVSALVISTLAIGIAATTIVFSLADAIIWHPLPFRDADRLVRIRVSVGASELISNTPLDFGRSFIDGLYPFGLGSAIVDVGGEPRAVTVAELSHGLLQTLGVAPIWGREFASKEYVAGNGVVIVSADLWRLAQSTARSPDDHTIRVEGVQHTIVGVMPAGFEFPVSRVSLWRPYVPDLTARRMTALGRLTPGVTIAQAQAFAHGDTFGTRGRPVPEIRIAPFVSINPSTATALRVLLGAVALLLLVATANAANIMQAEAVRRDTEFAVRASLGASWPRLMRQMMCESLLVSAVASIVALVVSAWVLEALVNAVPYLMSFQTLRPISVDWRAVLFAAGSAMLAGLGASWLSTLRALRIDPRMALRGHGSGLAGQARTRAALTVAQIAVTLVLLTGAGLLGNSFLRLSRVDPGFDPDRLIQFVVQMPTWRYSGELEIRAALEQVRSQTALLPDVVSVTISHAVPPNLESRPIEGLVTADGMPPVSTGFVSNGLVDEAFFATLRIPLLSGRSFESRDQENSPPVAVVSRAFAQSLWPGRDALGGRFRESVKGPWLTVVGVVGDVRNGGFEQPLGPLAYYKARAQWPTWWYEGVIVRTRSAPEPTVPAIRSTIQRTLPDAPIIDVDTGYDMIAGSTGRVRFATALMVALAGVALAIALIGVYGTFWCAVSQRTREIGVRIAVGATPGRVLRMVLAGSARLIVVGVAVGVPLSMATMRALESMLFEVTPNDPSTIAAAVTFLAGAAVAATYVPARRAASVDPVEALRTQ